MYLVQQNFSFDTRKGLCIARTSAVCPEVILIDEPQCAIDPVNTNKIEAIIIILKKEHTIGIDTHNMQQVQRIFDRVAFMFLGELIEYNKCENIL